MTNKVDIEDWGRLKYRMEEEGIEYCFKHYSSWEEIDDKKFHELRIKLIEVMTELENYINNQIETWDDGGDWETIPPQK
jgi:hypothetical protein